MKFVAFFMKLVMKFISSCMNISDAFLQSSESDVT